MNEFEKVLNYLSKKEWNLTSSWEKIIEFLNSKLKDPETNIEDIKSIKRYIKDFKRPMFFKHDLTTYKTGRVFAKYVLLPNKPILDIYIKKLFIPREGFVFASFDFKASQIRHLAIYNNLDKVKNILNSEKDIYEEFGREAGIKEREICKKIILLLSYGGSEATIEKQFDILLTKEQTKKAIQTFDKWFETEDMDYREKVQLSHIIQRKEADFLKEKMIKIVEKQNEFWCLHAFIHDEIICEIHQTKLEQIEKIKKFLEKNKEIKMEVETKISTTFQFK